MTENVERVLVVRDDWVYGLFRRRGFIHGISRELLADLSSRAFFLDRPDAEKDPAYRQVIPYVLLKWGGKYLTVTRHRTQTEARLHDLMSVGIGGHINPIDREVSDVFDAGLKRELSEELAEDDPPGIESLVPLGLICDSSDEVSSVHLGIVLRWELAEPVSIRETDKMSGRYMGPDEIGRCRDRLENWSRLVYDEIINASSCVREHRTSPEALRQ